MLNQKEVEILENLLKGKSYTYKGISEKYKISNRAARYYIDNIDYVLDILGYKITKKEKNEIKLEKEKNYNKLYEVIKNNQQLSKGDRKDVMKLILFFDKKGLNITKLSQDLELSRTTIKKDLKELEEELLKYKIYLIYVNGKGYKVKSNTQKLIIEQVNFIENTLNMINNGKKIGIIDYFYKYITEEDLELTREFIFEIEKVMKLNINNDTYNKIFSYLLILLVFSELYESDKELISKQFLIHTKEYSLIRKTLEKIFKQKKIDKILKMEILIQISDLVMGISINGFENNSFENWIDEELVIKKMIAEVSRLVNMDLTGDEILYNGLLYHIKPAMYRIRNNIQVTNSVFKELIIEKDPILDIVKKVVKEIENLFNIIFSEDEISLIGFHIKASIERNTVIKTKKVILVCGLGYGSSRVLEQSLKENYDLDIVDVLPYYLAEDIVPNYKDLDLVLSTIELKKKYTVPTIKINPILKEEDFIELKKYGIQKSNTKFSLKRILEIISVNSIIKNKENLILELKKELKNRLIDDLYVIRGRLDGMISRYNVKIIDKVVDWKEAINLSGNMLVENGVVKKKYVNEMIKMIEKYGAYMVIEDGLIMPHAAVSKNVFKTGLSLLVVKNKVLFPDGKGANIFLSFAANNKEEHRELLSDIFELVVRHEFTKKILKAEKYEDIKDYFRKEL